MRRPEGTDGSDHSYREVVDDAYKGAPIWRAAGWLLLHATAVPTALKAVFALIPYYTLRIYPQPAPLVLFGVYLLALLMWTLARPATYKESIKLVKATNTFVILGCAVHFLTLYKHHVMDTKQAHASRQIWKYLKEEKGWTGDWSDALDTMEAFLDGSAMICWGGTFYCLHQYITRKVAMSKKLAQDREQRGVTSSETATASPPVRAAGSGPRARRPGRA